MPRPVTDEHVIDYIASRLVSRGDCLAWTKACDDAGYGRVGWVGRSSLVHRALWEATFGPLDRALTLDHLCHTRDPQCLGGPTCPHRACANLAHLEPCSTTENTKRGRHAVAAAARWAARTHCANGHELTSETTRIDGRGTRHCRICDAQARHLRSQRRAAARVAKYGFDPGPLARWQPLGARTAAR